MEKEARRGSKAEDGVSDPGSWKAEFDELARRRTNRNYSARLAKVLWLVFPRIWQSFTLRLNSKTVGFSLT